MHSRSFLHRTASTPRASASPQGPEAHFALGFADVRAEPPAEPVERPRGPLGFSAPEPLFVTELSFRRSARTPRATADLPAPSTGALPTGHASGWRPADPPHPAETPVEVEAAPEPATMPAAEVPGASQSGAEHVPFYKREITLRRRRRPAEEIVLAATDESGEIGDEADEPVEIDAVSERERTIGFAAPADDEAAVPVADDELEVVEAEADEVLAAADDTADADVEDAETVELEPSAEVEAAAADDLPEAESSADDVEETDDDLHELAAAAEDDVADDATTPDETFLDEADADEAELLAEHDADDLGQPAAPASGRRGSIRARRGGTPASKPAGPKGPRGGRKLVGLKIGSSQLAAAVVARSGGSDQLVQLARTPLEPGIVVDGEVRDAEALRTALRTFFDENHLPRRDVRIGVASNRIGVRTVDIAGIDDQERFDNAVRFKAHEVLPVSFSESVLDYRVVEERATESGDVTKRVLLVVAPKDQVEPFAAACVGAGLKLAGADLEALGLLRAFVSPQAPGSRLATDTATVVVAIGHEATTLLVSGGGTCEFTRVFDWGGLALQQAIAQELDIHATEATAILHGLSLSGPGRAGVDEEIRARALDAVRTRLTPFARELVSSLQFYQAQSGSLGIGEIVITGGTSHLEGLADALHQMIGVAVRVGDPLQRLSLAHPLDDDVLRTLGSFAVPVGLAIEDDATRGVNLLPGELRKGKRKKPSALQVALPIAAVVPLAAMGFLFAQARGDVATKQDELSAVQAQIDALPEPTRPEIDPTLALDQQQRAAALATVLGGRLAWDRVLGDLSRVLPANVWLTKFSAHTPDPVLTPVAAEAAPVAPTVAPTPTGVTIEGYTYSVPDVARLLARLSTVPSLTNVVLGSSTKTEVGKKTAISFTIIADIDGNGGAQ